MASTKVILGDSAIWQKSFLTSYNLSRQGFYCPATPNQYLWTNCKSLTKIRIDIVPVVTAQFCKF